MEKSDRLVHRTQSEAWTLELEEMLEERIDALIEAGWAVLESNFSVGAFQEWKREMSECVAALREKEGTNSYSR